jgi:hypothetical protein
MTDDEIDGIDSKRFDEPQASRLFEHAMHEDMLFNERLNFFAVFESLLLATTATLFSSRQLVTTFLALFFAVLGVLITAGWMWIQHRQLVTLTVLVRRSEFHVPEFKETRILSRGKRRRGRSSALLAYFVPSVVLAMWLAVAAAFIITQWSHLGDAPPGVPRSAVK